MVNSVTLRELESANVYFFLGFLGFWIVARGELISLSKPSLQEWPS